MPYGSNANAKIPPSPVVTVPIKAMIPCIDTPVMLVCYNMTLNDDPNQNKSPFELMRNNITFC